MLKVENVAVMNMLNALRGARNPMNSWAKGDSYEEDGKYVIGPNDLSLAVRLRNAGSDDRKYLRQIFVSVDITAPIYWWKEFDTYKVGTVANSTSTMHKIQSKEITVSDFSVDDFYAGDECGTYNMVFENTEKNCEYLRKKYIETKDRKYWRGLIQLLPESYNQKRTVTMNYENLINMYFARRNHKLTEWHTFCEDFIEKLPYADELIIGEKK